MSLEGIWEKTFQVEGTLSVSSQRLQHVQCAQGTMKGSILVIANGEKNRMLEYAVGERPKAKTCRFLQVKARLICVDVFVVVVIVFTLKPLEDH